MLIFGREIQAGGGAVPGSMAARPPPRFWGKSGPCSSISTGRATTCRCSSRPRNWICSIAMRSRYRRGTHSPRDSPNCAELGGSWRRSLSGARERMQRVDLLRYQIEEIARANPRPDEEADLAAERARLANADRLARDAASAYALLAGEDDLDAGGAALPAIRQATQVLAELGEIDPAHEFDCRSGHPSSFSCSRIWPARFGGIVMTSNRTRRGWKRSRSGLPELRQLQEEIRGGHRRDSGARPSGSGGVGAAHRDRNRMRKSLAARETELAVDAGLLAADLSQQRADRAKVLATQVEQAIARLNMGAAEFSVALDRVVDPRGVPVKEQKRFGRAIRRGCVRDRPGRVSHRAEPGGSVEAAGKDRLRWRNGAADAGA